MSWQSLELCVLLSDLHENVPLLCRVPELREFCAEHGLVLTSIQDLRCLIRERQSAEHGGDGSASSFMLAR